MTVIIVVGHGAFGPALTQTAQMLVGGIDTARALEFAPGTAASDLAAAVARLIDEAAVSDGVLILTDIAGGTPSRVALAEAAAGRAHAVTGANLAMLVEALLAPADIGVEALAARVADAGRAGVRDLRAELAAAATTPTGTTTESGGLV